jgi:acetyl-CoA synthetase
MDAEDLLYLLYTSGTTAKPKGIVHDRRLSRRRCVDAPLHADIKPDSVYWCAA